MLSEAKAKAYTLLYNKIAAILMKEKLVYFIPNLA